MNRYIEYRVAAEIMNLMRDRRVLVIGGDRRTQQLQGLKNAFPDTAFEWQATRESDASLRTFDQLIKGGGYDYVIILHGLARHSHTRGARRLCSRCGKPLLWCRRPTPAAVVRALSSSRPSGSLRIGSAA